MKMIGQPANGCSTGGCGSIWEAAFLPALWGVSFEWWGGGGGTELETQLLSSLDAEH